MVGRNQGHALRVGRLPGGYGHVELVYDFDAGKDADGWLHALFRYGHRASGHFAETSFGSHIFNTALTYRGEPQSYSGPPPVYNSKHNWSVHAAMLPQMDQTEIYNAINFCWGTASSSGNLPYYIN